MVGDRREPGEGGIITQGLYKALYAIFILVIEFGYV